MCSYYFLEVTLYVLDKSCRLTLTEFLKLFFLSRNVLDKKGDNVDVSEGKFSFYIKEALKEIFGQV